MVAADRPTALTGGLVLLPGADEVAEATVICRGEAIETIVGPDDQGQPTAEAVDIVDVGGRLILPGIVDLHGDAFERCLMPRPGVTMGTDLALADNDAQLLAAGITTAYLSATDSWEPGLRSRDTSWRPWSGVTVGPTSGCMSATNAATPTPTTNCSACWPMAGSGSCPTTTTPRIGPSASR